MVLFMGILVFYQVLWYFEVGINKFLANEAILQDENLFCELWSSKSVFLKFSNGKTFFPE